MCCPLASKLDDEGEVSKAAPVTQTPRCGKQFPLVITYGTPSSGNVGVLEMTDARLGAAAATAIVPTARTAIDAAPRMEPI